MQKTTKLNFEQSFIHLPSSIFYAQKSSNINCINSHIKIFYKLLRLKVVKMFACLLKFVYNKVIRISKKVLFAINFMLL